MSRPGNLPDDDDLAQELSSQISFNNNLLQQLHDMEQTQQVLQHKLSLKDQELREVKIENENLKIDYEDLKDEIFQLEIKLEDERHAIQQSNDIIINEKDFRQRLERERDEYRAKYDALYEDFEDLKLLNERLKDEGLGTFDRVQQYEREIIELEKQITTLKQKSTRDLARAEELQSHNEWMKNQNLKDIEQWRQKYDNLKTSYDKLQNQYKGELEKKEDSIYNLETTVQKLEAKIQNLQRDSNSEVTQLKTQLQKESVYFDQYYTSLSDLKHEIYQWSTIAQGLQEKLNQAEHKNQSNINSLQLILQKDNVHLNTLYQEVMEVVQQKDNLAQANLELEQTLQQMELALEEERSKSIMLEEKVSKLAAKERELQRNFDQLERKTREQHHIELDKMEHELRSTKDRLLELQRDHKELQQQIHTLSLQNQTLGDRERKTLEKLKLTTDSMKQLQSQLEKTKDLLKTTQDERIRLTKECESLTYELHQSIQRKSSPRRRTPIQISPRPGRDPNTSNGIIDRSSTLKPTHSPLINSSQRDITPQRSSLSNEREEESPGPNNSRVRRFGQPDNSDLRPGAITSYPFSKLAQRNFSRDPEIQNSNRTLESKFRNLQSLNQKLKE